MNDDALDKPEGQAARPERADVRNPGVELYNKRLSC